VIPPRRNLNRSLFLYLRATATCQPDNIMAQGYVQTFRFLLSICEASDGSQLFGADNNPLLSETDTLFLSV
jgi:hypothetical protein